MFKTISKSLGAIFSSIKYFLSSTFSGLSIGLLVSMLIFAFVTHEVTYDQFHVNGRRIFKLSVNMKYMVIRRYPCPAIPAGLAHLFNLVVLRWWILWGWKMQVKLFLKTRQIPELKFKENSMVFTDPSFSVFSFKLSAEFSFSVICSFFALIISKNSKIFLEMGSCREIPCFVNTYLYSTGVLEDIR